MTEKQNAENRKRMHGARIRTCAGCGSRQDKAGMLRVVRTPEGMVLPDPEAKRDGRGAYVCRKTACLVKAQKRKSLERSLKAAVPVHVFVELREVIESHGTE